MNAIARIVSFIFHPLLFATYLFLFLSQVLPTALEPVKIEAHRTFILLIFLVTFVLPAGNLMIFKMFGTIKSLSLENRKERLLPFLFITIIYCVITFLFYSKVRIGLNDNFLRLMIVIDLLVIVSTIATLFFKVSVHSIGVWGMVGIVTLLAKLTSLSSLFYAAIAVIALAGIVMSSRLQLGAHSSREVMWGSVLGLVTSVGGMILLF